MADHAMEFIPLPQQAHVRASAPNAEVVFSAGIPWDDTYTHVRDFGNEANLRTYLYNRCPSGANPPYHLYTATPIKIGQMRCIMPEMETRMMNINYMMFNNRQYVDKWFFAFVTKLEWLGDNDCIVHFELDAYQNCAYKCMYYPCYVEREHILKSDDKYGYNTVPESLETGEIRLMKSDAVGFGNIGIGLLTTESVTGKDVNGAIRGGVYQGAEITYLQYDPEEPPAGLANGVINAYNNAGKIDAILDVYMIPEMCYSGERKQYTVTADRVFNGYVPRNNKLYMYPYCYVIVDNNLGTTGKFHYEYDYQRRNMITFDLRGELSPLPSVMLRTVDYNVIGISHMDAITYSQFAQCSFNSDVAKAWIAQNKNTLALNTANAVLAPVKGVVKGAISGGVAGALAGAVGGAISGAETIANQMAQQADREIEPAQIHGKAENTNINHAFGLLYFSFYTMSITADNAKSIDNYFDMFGYAVRKIKIPNITTRPYWNYVKTINCGFSGDDIAPDMLKKFRAIWDKGVTVWHTDEVGNYALNNNQ